MLAARRSNLSRAKGKTKKYDSVVLPQKPNVQQDALKTKGAPWIHSSLTDESMTSTDSSRASASEGSVEVVLILPADKSHDKEKVSRYAPSPLTHHAGSKIKQRRRANDDTSVTTADVSYGSKEPKARNESRTNVAYKKLPTATVVRPAVSSRSIGDKMQRKVNQTNAAYKNLPHAVVKYIAKCDKSSKNIDAHAETASIKHPSVVTSRSVGDKIKEKVVTKTPSSIPNKARSKLLLSTRNKATRNPIETSLDSNDSSSTNNNENVSARERKAKKVKALAMRVRTSRIEKPQECHNSVTSDESSGCIGLIGYISSPESACVAAPVEMPPKKVNMTTNNTERQFQLEERETVALSNVEHDWPEDEVEEVAHRQAVLIRARSLIKK